MRAALFTLAACAALGSTAMALSGRWTRAGGSGGLGAYEAPPVAATARARVAAQPAEMRGQIYQASLSGRARLDEVAELRAARQ